MDEQLPMVGDFDVLWTEEEVYGSKLKRSPPQRLDREQQAKDIVEAFQMIGGVPRLAHWAHEHPGFFFTKLLPRTLPQGSINLNTQNNLNITYIAAIAPSPLDAPPELEEPLPCLTQDP